MSNIWQSIGRLLLHTHPPLQSVLLAGRKGIFNSGPIIFRQTPRFNKRGRIRRKRIRRKDGNVISRHIPNSELTDSLHLGPPLLAQTSFFFFCSAHRKKVAWRLGKRKFTCLRMTFFSLRHLRFSCNWQKIPKISSKKFLSIWKWQVSRVAVGYLFLVTLTFTPGVKVSTISTGDRTISDRVTTWFCAKPQDSSAAAKQNRRNMATFETSGIDHWRKRAIH